MTIMEFCEKYKNMNSDKAKGQMVDSHIKRKYCPVIEKMTILQMMLDNSVRESENGIKYIDMMTSKINYTLAMVALYTDLTVDKKEVNGKEVGANFEDYDALIETGLVGVICAAIGEEEMKEFSTVNSMLIGNFERSEGSLEAYVGRVVGSVGKRINDVIDLMSNPGQLADLMETLGGLVDNK